MTGSAHPGKPQPWPVVNSALLVPFAGLLATIATVAGGVFVAILTNRKESKATAESAMEAVLRERLALKDEQIADLKADLARAQTDPIS